MLREWDYYSTSFARNLRLSCIGNIPEDGLLVRDFLEMIKTEEWFKGWTHKRKFLQLPETHKIEILAHLMRDPIIVDAQETIERQRIQQGQYMIVPNSIELNEEGFIIKQELSKLDRYSNNVMRYVIKSSCKERILKDLDKIGINEGFLFGDSVDHACNYIRESICGKPIERNISD